MRLLGIFYRFCLSLRYKVIIRGESLLTDSSTKLFLSNHQALVDPQIILAWIYKYKPVAPIVTEDYINIPLIGTFIKKLNAIPVSNLENGKRDLEVMNTISKKVSTVLLNKGDVILYPSGMLTVDGIERINNKRAAFQIISELPEHVKVIGVRINGLWGSYWSKAKTGKTPNIIYCFIKGIAIVLLNGIFFVPKKEIIIEFKDITYNVKTNLTNRKTLNNYLESFFNAIPIEKKKIKYFFWNLFS